MQFTLEYLIRISFGYDECKVYRFNVLTYLSLMPHFHFVGTIDIAPRIAACILLFLHSNSITYPKQIEIERSNWIQIVHVQRYAKKERKQTPTFRIRHRAISFSICWETNFLRFSILLFFFSIQRIKYRRFCICHKHFSIFLVPTALYKFGIFFCYSSEIFSVARTLFQNIKNRFRLVNN